MKLIISADDLGMSKSITDGIIYGIKKEYMEKLITLSSPSVLKALKSYYNFST